VHTLIIETEDTMTNARNYLVARFNADFNCPEFLDRTGVFWTLHVDKAQALTFDQAARALGWYPEAGVRAIKDAYAAV
jgi:hypothetical protein